MKKKFRTADVRRLAVFVLAMWVAVIPGEYISISKEQRIAVIIAIVAFWLIVEVPALQVSVARQYLMRGNLKKAFGALGLARRLSFLLSFDDAVFAASAYIQYGDDPSPGMAIIRRFTRRRRLSKAAPALTVMSMGLFREGKADEAIELLLPAAAAAVRCQSLYVNLVTYLFSRKRFDEGRAYFPVMDENLAAVQDIFGMSLMEQGRMMDAYALYSEMISGGTRLFPECLLHAVQTKIYYLKEKEALKLLDSALSMYFVKSSSLTEEYVRKLRKDICSPDSRKRVNANVVPVMLFLGYDGDSNPWNPPTRETLEELKRRGASTKDV